MQVSKILYFIDRDYKLLQQHTTCGFSETQKYHLIENAVHLFDQYSSWFPSLSAEKIYTKAKNDFLKSLHIWDTTYCTPKKTFVVVVRDTRWEPNVLFYYTFQLENGNIIDFYFDCDFNDLDELIVHDGYNASQLWWAFSFAKRRTEIEVINNIKYLYDEKKIAQMYPDYGAEYAEKQHYL